MPTLVIIDNLYRNRSFLMRLIKTDFKEKPIELQTYNIGIYDTEKMRNMANPKPFYEQKNCVFLLMGPNAVKMRQHISNDKPIIICPDIGEERKEVRKTICNMNYFKRIDSILSEKYDKSLFHNPQRTSRI